MATNNLDNFFEDNMEEKYFGGRYSFFKAPLTKMFVKVFIKYN